MWLNDQIIVFDRLILRHLFFAHFPLFILVDNIGYIEIKINGSKGNLDLTPEHYDIRELIGMLENVEHLLYTGEKKDRPIISYGVEKGSVKHIFRTSLQYIIGFNALIGQINQSQNIDFLDSPTAKAFEYLQETASKRDYSLSIRTSLAQTNEMEMNKTTQFVRKQAIWAEAEFYFYGKITNAGGKSKTNLHLSTSNWGTLIVQTPISFFEQLEENIIHKKAYGIRAKGKQNIQTGEIDTASLHFLELVDYQPTYDEAYLNALIEKATPSWSKIPDKDA